MTKRYLIDLRVLMAHAFAEDPDNEHAERFFTRAERERAEILVSASIVFEAEAVWLARKVDVPRTEWLDFIEDIIASPSLTKVSVSREVYEAHRRLYRGFGGKYSYFDSYHAATSQAAKTLLVTTDDQLLSDPDLETVDLKQF